MAIICWQRRKKKVLTQISGRFTQMHADRNRLNELSGDVIGCAFAMLDTLGVGFLEQAYENVLAHELRKTRLGVMQQRGVAATYDGIVVGE